MSTCKVNDCRNFTAAEINPSCNCKTTMKFEDYIIDELRNGKSMDEIMKYISDRANAAESTFKAEQSKVSSWKIIDNPHARIDSALTRLRSNKATIEDVIVLLFEGFYQIAPTMRPMIDEIDLDDSDINILAESMSKELSKVNKFFSVVKSDEDKITEFLDSLL